MSDSVRPHPWDSPGKNTGLGCHFLFQCIKVKSESEVTQSCLTLRDPMDSSLPGSSVRGIFLARVLESGSIGHTHNRLLFSLWFCLFTLSGVISPLFSNSILGTYRPEEFIFWCHIFLPFHTAHWGSQSKNTVLVCHSFLQWTTFCQNSPP